MHVHIINVHVQLWYTYVSLPVYHEINIFASNSDTYMYMHVYMYVYMYVPTNASVFPVLQ